LGIGAGQMGNNAEDNLNAYLNQLVIEACSYPAKSEGRRRKLYEIVRGVMKSGKLWKEDTPHYQDAMQQTWLHMCDNLEQYKPNEPYSCSLVTWLNKYLKWRLQAFREADAKSKSRAATVSNSEIKSDSNKKNASAQIELLPAPPDIPPILEEVRHWAETDSSGELRKTYLKGHPDVNCQILILLRLPPEIHWKTIAKNFGLPESTITTFYKREALSRLNKFGLSQGYL